MLNTKPRKNAQTDYEDFTYFKKEYGTKLSMTPPIQFVKKTKTDLLYENLQQKPT